MAEDSLDIRNYKSNDIVFKEGEAGDAAYIVEKGIVEISKESSSGGAALMLATIKRGKMFGEMALIDTSPRMATARAVGNTTLIVIPKAAFGKLLNKTDVVIRTILNTVMDRLRNQTDQNIKKTL